MLAIIVAKSRNGVIGKGGTIPWNIPGELRQFRELTTGNIVVMGRKTFEDIGRPLPGRLNIVVTGTKDYSGQAENLVSVRSLQEAVDYAASEAAGEYRGRDIYISGGAGIFKEAIPFAEKMFITEVDLVVEGGDTFFPEFDESRFQRELLEENDLYKRYLFRR